MIRGFENFDLGGELSPSDNPSPNPSANNPNPNPSDNPSANNPSSNPSSLIFRSFQFWTFGQGTVFICTHVIKFVEKPATTKCLRTGVSPNLFEYYVQTCTCLS